MPAPELSRLRAALTPRLTEYVPHRPEPPQTAFLLLDCLEAFYGGAAGGGKSDALLMAALQYVDIPAYSALLLRRTFPELAQPGAIMARSHEWLGPWRNRGVRWQEQQKRWTFPTGATLSFGYLRDMRDVYQYQSAEFQFVGFDELTQFPEEPYTYLFSRLRRPDSGPLSRVPLRMRSASNPGNVGHGWTKRRFVDPDTRGTRVFIPARLADNPHLDADSYVAGLMELPELTRRQLLDGDWGAFEGAAFPSFNKQTHVVDPFELPASWERFESVDPGINNPTAWLAWAVDHESNLLIFDSVYTDRGDGLPSTVAPRVIARRGYWGSQDAYADPATWARNGSLTRRGEPASLATEYDEQGISLIRANNDPRAGYTRVRELLEPDPRRRFPDWHPRRREFGASRLYVVGLTCPEVVDQLSSAPLQPLDRRLGGEIIDPDWESTYGHATAACRYGAMTRPLTPDEPYVPLDDPRAEYARRIAERRETPRRPSPAAYNV